MRATKYFRTQKEMTDYAKEWCRTFTYRWYARTMMQCDHVHYEKRKSIILVERETIIKKIIVCRTCNKHGNSLEIEQEVFNLKNKENGRINE